MPVFCFVCFLTKYSMSVQTGLLCCPLFRVAWEPPFFVFVGFKQSILFLVEIILTKKLSWSIVQRDHILGAGIHLN